MKTIYKVTVEFPTDLMIQCKSFLFETQGDARAFTTTCNVAGVKVLGQSMEHMLTPAEVAADIRRERQIASDLANGALSNALVSQKQLA